MDNGVRRIESSSDGKAVASARLRMGNTAPAADPAVEFAAFQGKRAIAGIAWSPLATQAEDSPWRERMARIEVPLAPTTIVEVQDLWFDPAACTGDAVQALLDQAMDALRGDGIELALLAVPPPMVSHAEILGFRRLGEACAEASGLALAMMLVTGDWAHLERVRSPLLAAARRHSPNFELPDWYDLRLREHHRPAGVRAQRADVFLHSLAASWQLPAAPLLEDMGSENLDCLRSVARLIAAEPGQVLLKKGNADRDLYLILAGAVEVSDLFRGKREVLTTLGAGQIFGEGGFFARTPRSADVTAIAPSQLLVLSPAAFELLGSEHPEAAIQVLQALGRTLCLRVYAGIAD